MRTYKLIMLFVLFSASLYAQEEEEKRVPRMDYSRENRFVIGLRGGINLSWISGFKHDNYSSGSHADIKFAGEITFDYLVSPRFQLLSGINYYQKGADLLRPNRPQEEIPKYQSKWIQVPLHAGYRLKTGATSNLVFHGGVYYAYGVGGNISWNDQESFMMKSIDFFSVFNKHDYGLGVGIDLNSNNLSLSVSYDYGLSDLAKSDFYFPEGTSDTTLKTGNLPNFSTRSLNITFGYKFWYPMHSK